MRARARAGLLWLAAAAAALTFWSVAATSAAAQAPSSGSARTLYDRAVTRERTLRAAAAGSASTGKPTLDEFRAAVGAYRRIVLQHPTSGYCDNALWQGARLSIEAFDRFRDDRDRLAALAMMRTLVREYPSSSLVRRARAGIQSVEALARAVPPPPAPARTRDAGRTPPEHAASPAPAPPQPGSPAGGPGAALAVLQAIERRAATDITEVVLLLDMPVTFHEERLDGPPRVFVDLVGTQPAETIKDAALTFETGLVRQVRVGRHPQAVTRVVLDAQGVTTHAARVLTDPHRIVITCWGAPDTEARESGAGTPQPAAATEAPRPAAAAPESAPPQTASPQPAPAQPVPSQTAPPQPAMAADAGVPPPTGPRPTAPSSNVRGGYSLARQLGLGASRIVIDPGHGGHDPGAMIGTTTEAAIVLDIALRLEKLLMREPGIDVVLTRRTNVYVPLQERTQIANREDADLFLSIHVNASRNVAARGVETYLLDFASTPDAESVAARENASSVMTMSQLNDLVTRIALTTKADESRDFAESLQAWMVRRLKPHNAALKNLGVKRAPFVVLIGAAMPSVLVEVAFITHRQERRLLASSSYRQRVADSLLAGVSEYLKALKKASPVVLQRDPAGGGPGGAGARTDGKQR